MLMKKEDNANNDGVEKFANVPNFALKLKDIEKSAL